MIFAWLERRREASRQQRWQDGYDYASGALLRGEKHKLEIEVSNPFDPNEFEDGMRAALLDWRFRGKNDKAKS